MVSEILKKAAELKSKLVDFAHSAQFNKEFKKAIKKKFGDPAVFEAEEEFVDFVDWFMLEKRFKDGETVLEKFIKTDTNLTEKEKEILLGWKKTKSLLFTVQKKLRDGFILVDVIEGKEYLVKPTAKKPRLKVRKGDYLFSRIVPLEDYYTFSGVSRVISKKDFERANLTAKNLAFSKTLKEEKGKRKEE